MRRKKVSICSMVQYISTVYVIFNNTGQSNGNIGRLTGFRNSFVLQSGSLVTCIRLGNDSTILNNFRDKTVIHFVNNLNKTETKKPETPMSFS